VASNRDAFEGSIMLWTGPGVVTSDLCERFAEGVQRALVGQEELEVQIEVVQDRPAFAGSEGNEDLVELARLAMRRAGLPTEVGSGSFTTDAGLFRARGMHVACFGPGGPLDRLYQDDEFIEVSRLESAARFYEQLIRAYCVEGR
jgi:acetylornithine deacetylase/succinyl-diaminopimelate desuccinylase-like protein